MSIEQIAKGLSEADQDWFWRLPCKSGCMVPLSFLREGLTKTRKKYWRWGEWTIYLTPTGKAVRAYLMEQSK